MPKRVIDPSLPRPDRARSLAAGDPAGKTPGPAEGRVVHDTLGIRIDRDGTWYYHGSPIHRKELVCLFASALRRGADGRYWLVTPRETGPIEVDDAPFIAVEMYVGGKGDRREISFRTNVDEIVTVCADHPLRVEFDAATGEPSPYVDLPAARVARLSRAVYYELVGLAEEAEIQGERAIGVWSGGVFFALAAAADVA